MVSFKDLFSFRSLDYLTDKQKLKISIIYDSFDLIFTGAVYGIGLAFGLLGALGTAITVIPTMGLSVLFAVLLSCIPLLIGLIFLFLYDVYGVFLAVKMFGGFGWISAWEILDPFNLLDAIVPTLTLLHLKKGGGRRVGISKPHKSSLIKQCKIEFKGSEEKIKKCIDKLK